MPMMSRRRLLSLSTIGAGSLLAGCTITRGTGTTTATINTAKLTTDGQAILSALSAILSAPSVIVALGVNYVTARAALVAAQAIMAEIQTLTGGSVTVTVDTARVQSLVTSLLSDAQTVLNLVLGIDHTLAGEVATRIGDYVAAALALIPVVQVTADLVGAAPPAGMSEVQALAIAHAAAATLPAPLPSETLR